MIYWHGEDREVLTYDLLHGEDLEVLMLLRLSVSHESMQIILTDYNEKIVTFHSIYDYFALLKAFNTNTINFHQYCKDKLTSHQPSHMHNTRHRTNSNFNTPLFNHSKTQIFYLYQVIPI